MSFSSKNSSYTVQSLVDIARAMGDLAPTLPTGGSYELVALSAINDAMTAMLAGSSKGSPFNFKFNRVYITPFFVNSYQQDYAQNNIYIGWLESCGAYNTSSTQQPKPFRVVEVKRDVLLTNAQTGNLAKIQWIQNDSMQYGEWGQSVNDSLTGLSNPGPGVVYTDPQGMMSCPANPTTQVEDSFGNLWALTTYGTCGDVNPFITNQNPNNLYPTLLSPTAVPPTVDDGSVVWTAINPKGQGFRINPMPTQTGPVWELQPVAQARVPQFTSLGQYLEPIPDDYFTYLKTGFFAQCYRFHPDPKLRTKFETEMKLWMMALDNAVRQGSREEDDWGFVPSSNVMDTGWAFNPVNPAMPYGPWAG
jgi:hypothetical protein